MSASFKKNTRTPRRHSLSAESPSSVANGISSLSGGRLTASYPPLVSSPEDSEMGGLERSSVGVDQHAYADKCNRLMNLLGGTSALLKGLRENNNRWLILYPHQTPQKIQRAQSFSEKGNSNDRYPLKRSNSFSVSQNGNSDLMDEDSRLVTSVDTLEFHTRLNVLKLEMKSHDHQSTEEIMESLERSSIAELLNKRIESGLKHLSNLHARIADKSSKVLVAGDLNAGKSTLVNALLRRQVLPVDQQPCTTMFCEVLDARENGGVEAIHAIKNIESYNREDPATFTEIQYADLYETVSEHGDIYKQLKIYCRDRRISEESLLHNGVVDIALVDCPGLNSDSLKTMAVFARQEEIDVIVFVVSAENHFTLSANQFLRTASNEKAYLFIIVNKFDEIKNKTKCEKIILDQIQQISPRTYEHSEHLVHFVSANSINLDNPYDQKVAEFEKMEEDLRNFVLKKRSKSKLAPAEHYLSNILADISVLSEYNHDKAEEEYQNAVSEFNEAKPLYDTLRVKRNQVIEEAEKIAEDTSANIHKHAKENLEKAINGIYNLPTKCEWSSILYVWQYVLDVKDEALGSIEQAARENEDFAKNMTVEGAEKIESLADANQLSGEARQVNINKLFGKQPTELLIHIGPTDLFNIDFEFTDKLGENLSDKLQMATLSGGALVVVASKYLGYKSALTTLWRFGNFVGFDNMKKLAIPLLLIAGAGTTYYLFSDMQRVVTCKVRQKVRKHLIAENYADEEGKRLARYGRKVMRKITNDLQIRFHDAVQEQEKRCKRLREALKETGEAKQYFGDVFKKSVEMSETLRYLKIDLEGN
ncbi:2733_t:CDS:2 [Paraglomus occultum]|uniref:2733_t:CDS:1 n=1 Tax=Paraglomus occultum TaxID=144539 RepID=A0A9N9BCV7_9GLOM|nr:2733_t:CDS:2 [Paraglomus occultum]